MGKKLQLPDEPISIALKIEEAMLKQGLTLEYIGGRLDIDKGQISRFRTGQFKTWSKNLQKLCNELQILYEPIHQKSKLLQKEDVSGKVESLDIVLKEVTTGWSRAGDKRVAYQNAILAITKVFS